MKYDKEKKNILEALENDELKLATPSQKEIESMKAAAVNTFKKDKRITKWKWESHTKRLYLESFTVISKVI